MTCCEGVRRLPSNYPPELSPVRASACAKLHSTDLPQSGHPIHNRPPAATAMWGSAGSVGKLSAGSYRPRLKKKEDYHNLMRSCSFTGH